MVIACFWVNIFVSAFFGRRTQAQNSILRPARTRSGETKFIRALQIHVYKHNHEKQDLDEAVEKQNKIWWKQHSKNGPLALNQPLQQA